MSRPADPGRHTAADDSIAAPEPLEVPVGEGDDDPLILWFLSLTLTQRLEVAQDFLDSVKMLKDGLRT
jgi:hypothetical protein